MESISFKVELIDWEIALQTIKNDIDFWNFFPIILPNGWIKNAFIICTIMRVCEFFWLTKRYLALFVFPCMFRILNYLTITTVWLFRYGTCNFRDWFCKKKQPVFCRTGFFVTNSVSQHYYALILCRIGNILNELAILQELCTTMISNMQIKIQIIRTFFRYCFPNWTFFASKKTHHKIKSISIISI
jgi:hypothetical protein